jgi:hypothetical protein
LQRIVPGWPIPRKKKKTMAAIAMMRRREKYSMEHLLAYSGYAVSLTETEEVWP